MLRVIFTAGLGCGVALAAIGPVSAADWPAFLGARGDGRSPETGILLDWSERRPRVAWVRQLGDGYAAPSVAGGRLFHFDRYGDRARLTCRDAASGDEIWRAEYTTDYEDIYGFGNGPRAGPVVDGERVYVFGVEGRLRCHRVTDGSLVWEVDTARRFGVIQNFFGVGSSPVVEDDLLIVAIGGSPDDSPAIESGRVSGNGSAIVAFDKRTGEERYRTGDELASYATPVVTTIGDRRWGFVFARGGLIGFEPSTGALNFHFPWRAGLHESVNAASPVVSGDRVLITEGYGPGTAVLRVRPKGFKLLWKDPPRGHSLLSHWATPVELDGIVYGCSGKSSGEAELRAVELAGGKVRWRRPGLGRSTAILVDGHLVLLTEGGTLMLVEATPVEFRHVARWNLAEAPAAGGRPLLRPPAWNAPVLSNGLLYLRGKDTLVALELIPRREDGADKTRNPE